MLASIITYRDKNPQRKILLCTNDVGPRLRAKQYGIECVKLSDDFLLPIRQSDEQKKINKLEKEIVLLKNRSPKLSFKLDNYDEFIYFKFSRKEYKNNVNDEITALRTQHPYINYDMYMNNINSFLKGFEPTREQFRQYNESLVFFDKYREISNYNFQLKKLKDLTFDIGFILKNVGYTPAIDIDVHLHFPDGFLIMEKDETDGYKVLPNPPEYTNPPI